MRYLILLCNLFIFAAVMMLPCAFTAKADMGAHPTTTVLITNVDERSYGTLICDTGEEFGADSYYRTREWDSFAERYSLDPEIDKEIYQVWTKFQSYEDGDGFEFPQLLWVCSETGEIHWSEWGYSPPLRFKVLLYFPERDEFLVSGELRSYAFHSYYSVDMKDYFRNDVTKGSGTLVVRNEYTYWWEIAFFLSRVLFTLLIEVVVALLFRIRDKKNIKIICFTNIATQMLLNIALFLMMFRLEELYSLVPGYLLLEAFVVIAEFIVYQRYFRSSAQCDISNGRIFAYALWANVFSFAGTFMFGGLM